MKAFEKRAYYGYKFTLQKFKKLYKILDIAKILLYNDCEVSDYDDY